MGCRAKAPSRCLRPHSPAPPAANGFANSTFIQNLRQGEAARMALALGGAGAANARYFCNLVGAGFGPCATNLGYTGAGAGYPINYFQANPYKTGETNPVSYLDSVGYLDLSRSAGRVTPAGVARAAVQRQLHLQQEPGYGARNQLGGPVRAVRPTRPALELHADRVRSPARLPLQPGV